MKYGLREIPGGEAGTDATVKEITRLVGDDLKRGRLRLAALSITRGCPSRDPRCLAQTIFSWIKSHIRFVNDPIDVETVQSPLVTLRLRAGDCDDHAGLFAGLAQALGLSTRYVVIGSDAESYSHIFPEVLIGSRWLAADTTEPGRPFGWRPGPASAQKIYNREGSSMSLGVTLPVTHGALKARIYQQVLAILRSNWRNGLINRADVRGYLAVIDGGNFPTKEPLMVEPTRRAISDFLNEVDKSGAVSLKPNGSLSGLEGLDGFLSSIWNGVKKVVGTVVKTVTGGSGDVKVEVQPPTVNLTTPVPPESARAGVAEMLKSPVVLVGLGLLAFMILKK